MLANRRQVLNHSRCSMRFASSEEDFTEVGFTLSQRQVEGCKDGLNYFSFADATRCRCSNNEVDNEQSFIQMTCLDEIIEPFVSRDFRGKLSVWLLISGFPYFVYTTGIRLCQVQETHVKVFGLHGDVLHMMITISSIHLGLFHSLNFYGDGIQMSNDFRTLFLFSFDWHNPTPIEKGCITLRICNRLFSYLSIQT